MEADNIRNLRRNLGLTQEEFAHRLGITVATVNRWENGKSEPSGDYARVLQTLRHITGQRALGPPIDWKRVGALSAMVAVAGFSPLLTLGAALAPVLIAQLPSWADVPVGSATLGRTIANGATPDPRVLAAPRTPRTGGRVGTRRGRGRKPLPTRGAQPRVLPRAEKEK